MGRAAGRLAAAALILLLAGCTGASPEPTRQPEVFDRIARLPGVAEVMPAAEEAWRSGNATVVVDVEAGDGEVLQAAREAAALVTAAGWTGELDMEREWLGLDDPDDELPAIPAWRLRIAPEDPEVVAARLDDLLRVERWEPVLATTVLDDWPSMIIRDLDGFLPAFERAAELDLYAEGGTFSLLGEGRLGVVWVPHRYTRELVEAVVQLAAELPDAELLVQATTAEPQWPKLYIARLTAEQAAMIEARLRDPALADVGVDGVPVPFQLGVLGPDGTTHLEGDIGAPAG